MSDKKNGLSRQLCELLDPAKWDTPGACLHCEEPVLKNDPRIPIVAGTLNAATGETRMQVHWLHRECAFRTSMGGALHVDRLCKCFVKDGPADADPPGLTKRDAAREALEAYRRTRSN